MFNPEYYVGEYRNPADGVWHTLRYHDELETPIPEGAETKIAERKPIVIVPVPAQSVWVDEALKMRPARHEQRSQALQMMACQEGQERSLLKNKRHRDPSTLSSTEPMSESRAERMGDVSAMAGCEVEAMEECDMNGGRELKRGGEYGGQVTEDDNTNNDSSNNTNSNSGNNACSSVASSAINDYPRGSCITYIYDHDHDADSANLKLNDVVHVIGIVAYVPELAMAHMEHHNVQDNGDTMLLDNDMLETHPPTSHVPRVHALVIRKDSTIYPSHIPSSISNVLKARSWLLEYLSIVLGGDELAAEYLLLQLVSHVQRTKQNQSQLATEALGVLPALNLTGCPSLDAQSTTPIKNKVSGSNDNTSSGMEGKGRGDDALSPFGEALVSAIRAVVPRCQALPLTVKTLNDRPWWPRREHGRAKLSTGPLQMAEGTQLVLDETPMQAGTLCEVGLRNLNALQGIMREQKVSYEFEVFALQQPTDSPVTILSTGNTLLKGMGEVAVPLRPKALPPRKRDVGESIAAQNTLEDARSYLSMARQLHVVIPDGLKNILEQEMVKAKQTNPKEVSPEVLHRWLGLALLSSASYGETELTLERWNSVVEMEKQREARRSNAVPQEQMKA